MRSRTVGAMLPGVGRLAFALPWLSNARRSAAVIVMRTTSTGLAARWRHTDCGVSHQIGDETTPTGYLANVRAKDV